MGDQSIKEVIPSDRTRHLRIHEVVRVEKSIKTMCLRRQSDWWLALDGVSKPVLYCRKRHQLPGMFIHDQAACTNSYRSKSRSTTQACCDRSRRNRSSSLHLIHAKASPARPAPPPRSQPRSRPRARTSSPSVCAAGVCCHRTAPQRAASRRSAPARRAFRVTIQVAVSGAGEP